MSNQELPRFATMEELQQFCESVPTDLSERVLAEHMGLSIGLSFDGRTASLVVPLQKDIQEPEAVRLCVRQLIAHESWTEEERSILRQIRTGDLLEPIRRLLGRKDAVGDKFQILAGAQQLWVDLLKVVVLYGK